MRQLLAALLLCAIAIAPALAWHRHGHHYHHAWLHRIAHAHHHARHYYEAGQILPHPSGCPLTEFCGCGVARKVFGAVTGQFRPLWLAANWLRFPRAMASAGMVAVFGRHHVAYIERVEGNGIALLYDPNSGHHLTRLHRMSIGRATIVDPHGGAAPHRIVLAKASHRRIVRKVSVPAQVAVVRTAYIPPPL